jgi:hypothetical protein
LTRSDPGELLFSYQGNHRVPESHLNAEKDSSPAPKLVAEPADASRFMVSILAARYVHRVGLLVHYSFAGHCLQGYVAFCPVIGQKKAASAV